MYKSINMAPFLSLMVILTACSPSGSDNQERTNSMSPLAVPPAPRVMAEGLVYTANEHANTISVIDAGTGQVKNIATGITPHNVQISGDGRLLLAVGPVAALAANKPR